MWSCRGLWWKLLPLGICPCPSGLTHVCIFIQVCDILLIHMLYINVLCTFYHTDVFKNALKLGTFPAILVTYTASALLHVSMIFSSPVINIFTRKVCWHRIRFHLFKQILVCIGIKQHLIQKTVSL